jgi:hypothetical protein
LVGVAARCRLRRAGVRGDGQGPSRGKDGLVQRFWCKVAERSNSSSERGLNAVKSGVFSARSPARGAPPAVGRAAWAACACARYAQLGRTVGPSC